MSKLVTTTKRNNYDRYATTKTIGALVLSAALIIDDSAYAYDLSRAGAASSKYFWVLVGLTTASLTLQVSAFIMALVMISMKYPDEKTAKDDPQLIVVNPAASVGSPSNELRRMNDAMTVMAFIMGAIHLLRSTL